MKKLIGLIALCALLIYLGCSLFTGCVDGKYQRRPFAFAPIQPPVFPMPQQQQGPVHTQVRPDGFGGYNATSSNGTNQRIQPNGKGGYTVWDGDGSVHQIIPDGNGGWTRY